MNNEDEKIIAEAVEFAKRNKNRIAKEMTALEKYLPDAIPVSMFIRTRKWLGSLLEREK